MADALEARFAAAMSRHGWLSRHGSLTAALDALAAENAARVERQQHLAVASPAQAACTPPIQAAVAATPLPLSHVTTRRRNGRGHRNLEKPVYRASPLGSPAPPAPPSAPPSAPAAETEAARITIDSDDDDANGCGTEKACAVDSSAGEDKAYAGQAQRTVASDADPSSPGALPEPTSLDSDDNLSDVDGSAPLQPKVPIHALVSESEDEDNEPREARQPASSSPTRAAVYSDSEEEEVGVGATQPRTPARRAHAIPDSEDEGPIEPPQSQRRRIALADSDDDTDDCNRSETTGKRTPSVRRSTALHRDSDSDSEDDAGSLDSFIVDDDDVDDCGEDDSSHDEDGDEEGGEEEDGGRVSDNETGLEDSNDENSGDEESDSAGNSSMGSFIVDDEAADSESDAGSNDSDGPGQDKENAVAVSPSTPQTPHTKHSKVPKATKKATSASTSRAVAASGGATPAQRRRNFAAARDRLVAEYLAEFNKHVFDGQLPAGLAVEWSAKLNTTAGRAILKRKGAVSSAHVELSIKVVDCAERLRNTFCHELCHVAAWLINRVSKPPHGKVFKGWAARAMRYDPSLRVETCHSYEIDYKFRWQCQTEWCAHIFGRHSKSVDVDTQRCGRCNHGRLALLPRLRADGTPCKARQASAFSVYVKRHFARVKKDRPDLPHGDVMRQLGTMFREMNVKDDNGADQLRS